MQMPSSPHVVAPTHAGVQTRFRRSSNLQGPASDARRGMDVGTTPSKTAPCTTPKSDWLSTEKRPTRDAISHSPRKARAFACPDEPECPPLPVGEPGLPAAPALGVFVSCESLEHAAA